MRRVDLKKKIGQKIHDLLTKKRRFLSIREINELRDMSFHLLQRVEDNYLQQINIRVTQISQLVEQSELLTNLSERPFSSDMRTQLHF